MTSLTETTAPTAQQAVARYRHGRVPRAVRERQILELASDLFAERGYAAASMDELARRAGVSKPVVYGLFGSKEGLFAACAEELGRELTEVVVDAVEGAGDAERLLRTGSRAFFDFIRERRGLWTAIYSAGTVGDSADAVLAKVSETRRRQNELVQAVIVVATGELGLALADDRAEGMARALNGMFEGLASWAIERPEIPAEEITDWVVDLVIPGLDAMVARQGGGS